MATGLYYKKTYFNLSLEWTKRRIVTVVPYDTYVQITIPKSLMNGDAVNAMPLPVSTTSSPKFAWIVESGQTWLNGWWRVTYNSGTTIRLDKKSTGETYVKKSGFTPNVKAAIFRVDGYNNENSPSEVRKVSWVPFDTALGVATTPYPMCAKQNQVYTFLKTFYNDPEVRREYDAKYEPNASYWDDSNYGPDGGWESAKILRGFMCTVHAESSWNANKKNESDYRGLWQISPDFTGTSWWPTNQSLSVEPTLYNIEYNSRAALWLMARRLFKFSASGTEGQPGPNQKPFKDWEGSKQGNEQYSLCQETSTSINNLLKANCP